MAMIPPDMLIGLSTSCLFESFQYWKSHVCPIIIVQSLRTFKTSRLIQPSKKVTFLYCNAGVWYLLNIAIVTEKY